MFRECSYEVSNLSLTEEGGCPAVPCRSNWAVLPLNPAVIPFIFISINLVYHPIRSLWRNFLNIDCMSSYISTCYDLPENPFTAKAIVLSIFRIHTDYHSGNLRI